jgi:arylsulfatase A-like enzyme
MQVMPSIREISRAAALAAALAALSSCGARRSPPNILLVTVDTLRADHVGAWGYPRDTTPAFDAFVASGTSFRDAITPRGQTWPTLASILTSRYPVTHGIRKNGEPLADGMLTLGEVLGSHGYERAAFLSNSGQAGWPGFDSVEDARDQDRHLVSAAKGWLRANAGKRFFVWIHLFAPHRPFQPPAPYDTLYDPGYHGPIDGSIAQMDAITAGREGIDAAGLRAMIARYDGEVRTFDALFGELTGTLDELGLTGNTLVAVTGDHGEELFERHRYFSHSASIYDTVLHVPLAFRLPGVVPAGREVPGIVESIDLAPTLLALAGLPVPRTWEGRPLAPVILGRATLDPDHAAYSELEDRIVSLRTLQDRYIYNPDDFAFPMEGGELGLAFPFEVEELYEHADDPGERHDRAADRPDLTRALRERTQRWMERHDWEGARQRHAGTRIPDEVRKSLEAIGYVN